MSSSLNKVTLIGNLGKDPELKTFEGGKAVCSFSIATSEKWNDKQGNKQEKTEWHNIKAWEKLGEICGKYLSKGKKVYVEGKLSTRSYEKDGEKKYITEIVAKEVIFLSASEKKDVESNSHEQQSTQDDSIPF